MKTSPPSSPNGVDKPVWTVRSLLSWTSGFFERHGILNPRLDAEVLLAHVLGGDRLSLYLNYEKQVSEDSLALYRQFVQRRVAREPVAYITGIREFFSMSFRVNGAVLIPRPETEHVIEHALLYAKKPLFGLEQSPLRILDVGTGSGNIAITLARHLPEARIVAVDSSFTALVVASENARATGDVARRTAFLLSDLFGALHPERAKFHMIVSNPPYIPTGARDGLEPEVRCHEPWPALDGGPDGTAILRRILLQAWLYLVENGVLISEIGEDQPEKVLASARETGAYRDLKVCPDYAGKPRVLLAQT